MLPVQGPRAVPQTSSKARGKEGSCSQVPLCPAPCWAPGDSRGQTRQSRWFSAAGNWGHVEWQSL